MEIRRLKKKDESREQVTVDKSSAQCLWTTQGHQTYFCVGLVVWFRKDLGI